MDYMSLKQKYNNLLEKLKFPFYAEDDAAFDITYSEVSSQTSVPQQQEDSAYSFNPFGSYTNSDFNMQMQSVYNKNEMIRRWREISFLPEVTSAIDEICNEAIVYDEVENAISLNLSDIDLPDSIKDKMQDSFTKINYLLDFYERGDELFRQWYVDGTLNFEVVYNNDRMREGIKKLILLSPVNFNCYIDKESGVKKYYFSFVDSRSNNTLPKDEDKVFLEEQITNINSGLWNIDKSFPISYLNPAIKTINQLSNIEDTLVIHRLTKSIEKRIFKIPTKNLPKTKAEEYIRSLMMKYRQKKVYNTDLGIIENKNRSISVLEDFWIPVDKDGSSMSIENLPAVAQNFTSFEDVDYFVTKLYKALKVPLNRRLADSKLTQGNQIDIEKEELKFFKFILKLRRKFNNIFIDLLKKDLIAKKVLSLEEWRTIQDKIKFNYANSNQYTEIKNNQIISMRVDTANSAMGLVDAKLMSKLYVQTNILKLTDDDIEQINTENTEATEETQPQEEEDMFSDFSKPEKVNSREPIEPEQEEPTPEPEEEPNV
jgi:hypothetical protein